MYVNKLYQMAVDSYGDVRTLVRGLPYQCPDDWEDVLDSLDEDSELYLIKEPDNPKDPLAIAVYLGNRRVGYVAASDNEKIWLYLTDEKTPCTFIERFEASFKISFENPRVLFLDMPFKEIYKDKDGVTEDPYAAFDIPFLTNPKDKSFDWYDDRTYIMDLEKFIPDFRRKLAARMILLVGRKNSKGKYCYYLPYANNVIADINDGIIKSLIDRYGFVIALPDVPMINSHGIILMDLHVTFIKNTDYKDFDFLHQSELVFNLVRDYNNKEADKSANGKLTETPKHTLGGSMSIYEELFPLFGITLGKTTWKQAEDMGYKVKLVKDSQMRSTDVDDVTFWDDEGVGLFTSLSWYHYSYNPTDFPTMWKSKGFSWDLSYDEWMEVFKKLGFKITVNQQPTQKEYSGHKTLHAKFESLSPDGRLLFTLYFDYGEEGYYTSSPKTLYNIDVEYKAPVKEETATKEFASDDKDTNEHISDIPNNASKESSIIDEFFPLFGITLGETTCKQVEDMGNKVEVSEGSNARYTKVGGVHFWDDEGVGILTSLYWFYHYIDFPPSWKSKGFSWDNSYDEWIEVFKKMGFNITVTKQPTIGEFCGNETLSAKFEAISPDGILLFNMNFDNGEDGYYTSSPKTLDTFSVYCKKKVTAQNKPASSEKEESIPENVEPTEEYYSVTDSPEGGKHVSMGVIVPEEGDKDFDFCSYNCHINDKEKINIITKYMKRFEEGKESRPFLMIGRPCLGLDDIYIFYSLDGEIIFNFIFDETIKGWIREAGFVLGKVKEYHMFDLTNSLDLTLSVSKRKSGEELFNQASEEAMDFVEEYTNSIADTDVEEAIITAVEDYKKGKSSAPYKVLIIPENGIGVCTTINGEQIATVVDEEIIELAEKNKGAIGYITDVDYDEDGISKSNVWFTVKVSRSIPRISLD